MQAVIIAGGKGTRLRPYTNILPKPLLPIGLRSILEINIRQLKSAGINDIIIAVGYLGHLIESIIGNGKDLEVSISYIYENEPLGTSGALGLMLDGLEEEMFVMNGDVLHNIDFNIMNNVFKSQNADIAITVFKKEHHINLGVLEIKDDQIMDYIEKPTNTYYVSAGIYKLKKQIIKDFVPKNRYMDFPSLINIVKKSNSLIVPFYHEGLWIDLGTESEYQLLLDNLSEIMNDFPSVPILI
jgi:NDP-mannose synthase